MSSLSSRRAPAVHRAGSALVLVVLAGPLAGCGSAEPGPPERTVAGADEPEAGHGRPCPRVLPEEDAPGRHGLGPDRAADELPVLPDLDEAWLCRYDAGEADPGEDGDGATYDWRRSGRVVPVDAEDLPGLEQALDGLELVTDAEDRVCTADLGPRWMVVLSGGGDLTGVVVDDYGCRDVRLSDDPHATVPGAPGQDGAVRGVLEGGTGLLEALDVGRTS